MTLYVQNYLLPTTGYMNCMNITVPLSSVPGMPTSTRAQYHFYHSNHSHLSRIYPRKEQPGPRARGCLFAIAIQDCGLRLNIFK